MALHQAIERAGRAGGHPGAAAARLDRRGERGHGRRAAAARPRLRRGLARRVRHERGDDRRRPPRGGAGHRRGRHLLARRARRAARPRRGGRARARRWPRGRRRRDRGSSWPRATSTRSPSSSRCWLRPSVEGAPEGFDPEETGTTLFQNAWIKAAALRERADPEAIVVADDSGLVVHALGGRAGRLQQPLRGADATYEDNCRRLLEELEGVEDREAAFVCVLVGLAPGDRMLVGLRHLRRHDRPGAARLGRLRLRPAVPARGRDPLDGRDEPPRRRRRSPIGAAPPAGWPSCSGPVDVLPRGAPGPGHRGRRPHRTRGCRWSWPTWAWTWPSTTTPRGTPPSGRRPSAASRGVRAEVVAGDLGRPPGCRRVVAEARRRWGAWTCWCARRPTSSRPPSRRPPRSSWTRRSRST